MATAKQSFTLCDWEKIVKDTYVKTENYVHSRGLMHLANIRNVFVIYIKNLVFQFQHLF